MHLLTAAAESFNVNTSEYIINRSLIKRSREKCREELSEAIKSKFKLNLNLQYRIVYWDSKLLSDLTGWDIVDRLPVIITAPNVEQLLGVPQLSSGTGNEISLTIYNTLQDWCLMDQVEALVFDTTASNSGRINGACVLLEQKLNRNIIFFACRHHIFSVVLQAVFVTSKLSIMSGPDIPLFKRFKNNWVNLDLLNVNFPRDDYKEFIELVMIFLEKTPPRGKHFRPPGAYHLARWMAKGIYCHKMLLFYKQCKLSILEKISLQKICCFIIKCYLEAWICAPNPITAPFNGIIFLTKLVDYTKYNKKIGEVAIKKFIKYLWYLNKECAVFSLFDDCIDDKTKCKMAKWILEISEEEIEVDEQNEDFQKKIILRFDDVQHFLYKDLPFELISNKSIQFFQRFRIPPDFLHKDPSLWKTIIGYKHAKDILTTLKVVNNTAERDVKLMQEFNDKFTNKEEQKQYVLQIIQDYKKQYPGFSREVLKQDYNN